MAPWSRWQWTFCGFTTASTWELLLVGMFYLPPQNNVISFDFQYILASIFKLAILLNLNMSMVVCCQQRLPNKRIFQKNTSPYKLLTQHFFLFVYFIHILTMMFTSISLWPFGRQTTPQMFTILSFISTLHNMFRHSGPGHMPLLTGQNWIARLKFYFHFRKWE